VVVALGDPGAVHRAGSDGYDIEESGCPARAKVDDAGGELSASVGVRVLPGLLVTAETLDIVEPAWVGDERRTDLGHGPHHRAAAQAQLTGQGGYGVRVGADA